MMYPTRERAERKPDIWHIENKTRKNEVPSQFAYIQQRHTFQSDIF